MIEVILFYGHAVFFTWVFAKNFVEESFLSSFLSTIFVIVIFSVGWTFSAFVIGFIIPDAGLSRILTKAAFSLALLTILEVIFYRFYFSTKKVKPSIS
ncbi:MAG: hypothetical protein IT281_05000 [Ignavibacteria bacterium]|nr:hypothetical protein [Ignavibacteria bacterium]